MDLEMFRKMFEDAEDGEIRNLFPAQGSSEPPSKVVVPIAGFCVKTVSTESHKKKTFINICHTDGIPNPNPITEEQLRQVWGSEADQHATYRIPMSLSGAREERDKKGEVCDVFDVAIGTGYFHNVEKNLCFRTFLLQVIFEGLASKHGAQLSISRLVILKNRKSMGTILPHRIEVRNTLPHPKLIEAVKNSKIPNYVLKLEGRDLVCKFHVPNTVEKDIKLLLGEDRMRVEAPPEYLVDIFIPFTIDPHKVVALFNAQTETLKLTVPVSSSQV